MSDVDAVFTTPVRVEHWNMPAGVVAGFFSVRPSYLSTVDVAGASGCAMIDQAIGAVEAGKCEVALCVAGQNLLSNRSRSQAVQSMAERGSAPPARPSRATFPTWSP